jgi:glycosyltransferase involved in cell wall biosynthesis
MSPGVPLRIEILANDRASFVKPMADGLARMLKDCGAQPRVHYDGIAQLMRLQSVSYSSPRSFVGSLSRLASNRKRLSAFVEQLRGADAIVIVAHVPASFSRNMLPIVEELRRRLPDIPIVNYDLVYLPTLDSWSRVILKEEKTKLTPEAVSVLRGGKFGLERYDWYLLASAGTYVPLPPGPHPYSLIGLNIDDGRLFPEQNGEFSVIVDFEQTRGKFREYRKIQLEALKMSGLKYEVLEGSYTRDEMLAVFRRSSVLMLAHAESFGLPICEAQACGCFIFTPDLHWNAAHWLGKDYYIKREPKCSPNFVVYENDPKHLAERLRSAAANFNPERVRDTFISTQPELFSGDRAEVLNFLEKLASGKIHSRLHPGYRTIDRPEDDALEAAG